MNCLKLHFVKVGPMESNFARCAPKHNLLPPQLCCILRRGFCRMNPFHIVPFCMLLVLPYSCFLARLTARYAPHFTLDFSSQGSREPSRKIYLKIRILVRLISLQTFARTHHSCALDRIFHSLSEAIEIIELRQNGEHTYLIDGMI